MIFDLISQMGMQQEAPPATITVVGNSKAQGTPNATVPSISGLAVGDMLVAFLSARNSISTNLTFSAPAGWTELLAGSSGANPTVCAKVADAADVGATFAFSANFGGTIGAIVVAVRGVSPILASIGLSTIFSAPGSQSSPYDCPSNSVVAPNTSNIVFRFYSGNSALSMSIPTDTTLVNFSGTTTTTKFNQVVSELVGAVTAPSKISTFSGAAVGSPGGLSIAIPSA